MSTRMLPAASVLAALLLVPLAGCSSGPTTRYEVSYEIAESVTALVVEARAASVAIVVADGPVTVTEEHRYAKSKPITTHQVEGQTLRLAESGCGDDDVRCSLGYTIRMPRTMSARIAVQAGAVVVDGLAGDLHVSTQAGAVQGRALTSEEVIVETEVGAASLEFAQAPASINTTSSMGSVEIRVPGSTAYAVDVRSSAGTSTVDVDRNPDSAHRIAVRTEVGSIKIARLT